MRPTIKQFLGCSLVVFLSACACKHACKRGCDKPHHGSAAPASLLDPASAPESVLVKLDTDNGKIRDENVFSGFGCTGANKSLGISWSGAPAGTQSYVLIIHDPDAPTGVGFFHWTVFDIPKETGSLPVGAPLPAGAVQGYTDLGAHGYGGPCPPPGVPHRYIATVYALDVPHLGATPSSTGALLRFMVKAHTLALGRATGTYGR